MMRRPVSIIGLFMLIITMLVHPLNAFAASSPAPSKPGAPTVTLTGDRVSIAWKAASGAVAYEVYRRDEGDYKLISQTSLLSTTDTVPNVYRSYDHYFQYEVVAVGSNGKKSSASKATQIRIPNNAATTPQNVKVINKDNNVTISWNESANAISYKVYRSSKAEGPYVLVSNENQTTTQFADTSFPTLPGAPWSTYYYQITAVNAFGIESQKAYANAMKEPPALPNKPNVSIAGNSVTVEWNAIPNTAKYEVALNYLDASYQYITKKLYSTEARLNIELIEFDFSTDTSVSFMVRAIDLAGNTSSWYSNPAVAIVPKAPFLAPKGVHAALSDNSAIITWDPHPKAAKYQVYRQIAESNPVLIGTTTDLKYVDQGLPTELRKASLDVRYSVGAVNASGTVSPVSEQAIVTLAPNIFEPAAPQNLIAVQNEDRSVTLNWEASAYAAGYQVYRMVGADAAFKLIAFIHSGTSYTDVSVGALVSSPQTVQYKINAINAIEDLSPYSNVVQIDMSPEPRSGNEDPKEPDTRDPGSAYSPPPALSSGNLLSNASFSKFKSDVAVYWIKQRSNAAIVNEVQAYQRTDVTDNWAQRIAVGEMPNNGTFSISQRIPLTLGQEFRASGMIDVRALENAKIQLYVDFYENGDKWVRSAYQELGETTSGFVPIKIEGIVPNRSVSAKVYVIVKAIGDSGNATIIVDDLSFSVGNGIIVNADFQSADATTGLPTAWGLTASSNTQFTIQVEEAPDSLGKALAIETTKISSNAITGVFQKIPVGLAQGRYSLRSNIYVTALKDAKAQAYVDFYDSNNAIVGSRFAELAAVTDQYVPLNVEGTLPEGAVTAKILIILRGVAADAAGKMYVKNVSLNFDQNRLMNEGFEQLDANGAPTLWVITATPGVTNLSEVTATRASQGVNALRIAAKSLKSGQIATAWQKVPVTVDDSYEFSANLSTEKLDGSKVQLYVDFLDSNQKVIKNANVDVTALTNDFVKYNLSGIVPAGAKYAKVYVILRGLQTGGEGSFLVDGLSFQTSRNRLVGSTFESVGNYPGIAYGWGTTASKKVVSNYEVIANGDGKAQQLSAANLAKNEMAAIYQKISIVRSGYFYSTAQLQVTNLNNAKVQLYIDFYDSSNKIIGSKSSEMDENTDGFVPMSISGTIPAGTTYAKLYVILRSNSDGGSGTIVVDNAKFEVY